MFCRSIEHPESPVIFIHQSKWQQEMLLTYGADICLIDATYKTTIYDMPLFFLCVFTNVGYVNVATFLLVDECQNSIAAGLKQIAEWNPTWKPAQFITDFSEAQISALEEVFPGLLHLHMLNFVLCAGLLYLSHFVLSWTNCVVTCFISSCCIELV